MCREARLSEDDFGLSCEEHPDEVIGHPLNAITVQRDVFNGFPRYRTECDSCHAYRVCVSIDFDDGSGAWLFCWSCFQLGAIPGHLLEG